jgi:hypothetical protein
MKEEIKYTVNRGPKEPVIEQRKASIILYDKYIEVAYDYDYKPYNAPEDYRKSVTLIPKSGLWVELQEYYHEDDPDRTMSVRIVLRNSGEGEYICASTEEIVEIYSKVKTWLLK